jgi:hypothetical protein
METALLGQFQPQTQQTGFASRKFSLLVKEQCAPKILEQKKADIHPKQNGAPEVVTSKAIPALVV